MMNKQTTALLAALSLMITPAAAQELQISGLEENIQLTAGENITEELYISYNGQADRVAYLEAIIEAEETNTQGIEAEFSNNPVIAPENGENTVELHISTSYYLVPDSFTINVTAETEIMKPEEKEQETVTIIEKPDNNTADVNESGDDNNSIQLQEDIEDLNESNKDLNESVDDKEEKIEALKNNISMLRQENTGLQENVSQVRTALIILASGIFLSVFAILLSAEKLRAEGGRLDFG